MITRTLNVEIEVLVTKGDYDSILYEALDNEGIAEWADCVEAIGGKRGDRLCEQISLGGTLNIHERTGEWHELTLAKMLDGIKLYLRHSSRIFIVEGQFKEGDMTPWDADIIVQFALFGEVRY